MKTFDTYDTGVVVQVMRGIEGELYICDKCIFEKTYELL